MKNIIISGKTNTYLGQLKKCFLGPKNTDHIHPNDFHKENTQNMYITQDANDNDYFICVVNFGGSRILMFKNNTDDR